MMEFNHDLTREQLLTLQRKIKSKIITKATAAKIIGVHPTIVSRWIAKGRKSIWEWYEERKEYEQRIPQEDWPITTPEGKQSTYGECAKALHITVGSFAKRVRKHGPDNPRVWVPEKFPYNRTVEVSRRANWEGLTNRSRDHRLAKIPSPTRYEKQLIKR